MLNACAGALVGLALLSAIVYNSPPCLPGSPGARGLIHSFLHQSLGLRLSDWCVLCRYMVLETIFKKGGASGSACGWARVPNAPKKSLTNGFNFGKVCIEYKRGCDFYVKLPCS